MDRDALSRRLVDLLQAIDWDPKPDNRHYRYTLRADVTIPLPVPPPGGAVEHRWCAIHVDEAGQWWLTIKKDYAWDGATGARDFAGRLTLGDVLTLIGEGRTEEAIGAAAVLIGTVSHDPLYQFIECLAHAWDAPISVVRRWADDVFGAFLLLAGASPGKTTRFYWAVRVLGGVFNWWGRSRSRLNPLRWF